MAAAETIKDYLVSIGMGVDKKSFDKADKAVKNVDKNLGKFAVSSIGNFAKLGGGAASLAVAVGAAMGKFALSVAEADRQTGLLARRLFTTKENARSLSIAMKQMNIGSIEQLREVSADPEMREQFLELKNLARSLENPKTKQAMKEIREINFEIQKLMVRFEYFKINVAAKILEIFKQLHPTIQKIIDWFKPIVQTIFEVKDSFKGAIPNIKKGIDYLWKGLKPILGTIRATIIFVLKGWKMIFDGIKEMPTAFRAAFEAIKFILDPIIKMFRFIEDLIVYLAGGSSYREKMFDKFKPLKKIRKASLGDYSDDERTPEEIEKENRETIKEAQKNIKFGTSKNYKWGENVHGFQAARVDKQGRMDPRGLTLSDSNLLAVQSLSEAAGNVAKKFKITSGYESGHSKGSLHDLGRAMDFGFAGTTLQDQVALIRAALKDNDISKALIEVDALTRNQIYNQLRAEGADISKLAYKETPAANNHLHLENVTTQQALENRMMKQQPVQQTTQQNIINNNFNIMSTDPKEAAAETNRELSLIFGMGGISP